MRIPATGPEIEAEIRRRLAATAAGRCSAAFVPTPMLLSHRDATGCNWTFNTMPCAVPGCEELVEQIARQMQAIYYLVLG